MGAHPTFNSMRARSRREAGERVASRAAGGPVASKTVNNIIKAVHEHEQHDHPGVPQTKIKLRDGGHVEGDSAPRRPDRAQNSRAKRADGGSVSRGKRGAGNHVNIIIASPGDKGGPAMPPVPPMAARAAPPIMQPPISGPPGAPQMPMGRPPIGAGVPPIPRRRGGRAQAPSAGAGSALGRLEKADEYGAPAAKGENKPFAANAESRPARTRRGEP